MQVTTKLGDKSATVEYEFGGNLEESVGIFGEDRVHDHFVRNAKIALQGFMSRMLKADKTQADIEQAVAGEFKLEGRKPGKSKVEKASELLAGMTDEEKAAFRKLLKGAA